MAKYGEKSWEDRREWRIVWLRPFVATFLALGPFLLSWLVIDQTKAQAKLADWPWLQLTLNEFAWAKPLVNDHPVIVIFVVMWLGALWRSKATAEKLHDRAFGEFNDDLFYRIQVPIAATAQGWTLNGGALPFLKPTTGARRKAWDALYTLVQEDVGDGRTVLPWSQPKAPQPLTWMIILGRPGSGKSRMVQEFAREIGRRELLGNPGQKWTARTLSWMAWLRSVAWFLARRPEDPWDAGRLSNTVDKDAVSRWQPARPTLLWLDDPEFGVAQEWISTLSMYRSKWVHPVRLVICNQSVPDGLHIELNMPPGPMPDIGGAPMATPPAVLAASARFGRGDIRQIVTDISVPLANRQQREHMQELWRTENIETVLVVTRGNPLLVELALDWHRQGNDIHKMSEDNLLADRAQRVLAALAAAGLGNEQSSRLALAASTLVGPHAATRPIVEIFGDFPLIGDQLRNLVPGDADFEPVDELPAIRPEMIGDAVVRAIIAAAVPEYNAGRVVRAGFKARPGGWLRAVERCGRKDDYLGRALQIVPDIDPSDLQTREQMALAWIDLALFGYREPVAIAETLTKLIADAAEPQKLRESLWERFQQRVSDDADRRTASIAAHLASADAGDAAQAEEPTEDEDLVEPMHRFVRGKCIALVGGILRAAAQPPTLPWDAMMAELMHLKWTDAQIAMHGFRIWTEEDDWQWARSIAWVFAESEPLVDAQVEQLRNWHHSLAPSPFVNRKAIDAGVAWRLTTSMQSSAKAVMYSCLTHAHNKDPATCAAAVHRVEAITGQPVYLEDRDVQRVRALAWRHFADAQKVDPAACKAAAERVEAITGQPIYLHDRDMQHERALAWRYLADAQDDDPAACKAAAERVETITGQPAYLYDYDMQFQRAQAWLSLAHVYRNAPAACEAAVDRVEAITGQPVYLYDYDMQNVRAAAWRCLAYVQRNDPATCVASVDRVEAIAGQSVYLYDYDMQFQRASAWKFLASAQMDYAAACKAAVDRVEAITGEPLYLHDRDMQFQRAEALRVLTFAQKTDPAACKASVDRVEAITGQQVYLRDRDMQNDRAGAWRSLASAQLDDAKACKAAVERVEAITAQPDFLQDRDMQHERAQAWRSLAFVHRNAPAACEAAVDRVEAITAQPAYVDDHKVQYTRASAWRFLAHAQKNNATAYEEAIASLRTIIAPWLPGAKPPFQHDKQICEQFSEAVGYRDRTTTVGIALPDTIETRARMSVKLGQVSINLGKPPSGKAT
jgi:hypothetical protein